MARKSFKMKSSIAKLTGSPVRQTTGNAFFSGKNPKTKVDKYNYRQKKMYDIESGWIDKWEKQRDEALNYDFSKGESRIAEDITDSKNKKMVNFTKYHNTAFPGTLTSDRDKPGTGINAESRRRVIEYFDSIKPKTPTKPTYKINRYDYRDINRYDYRDIKNIDMQPVEAGISIDKSKYIYSKYYDANRKEYRVRIIDKSRKGKSNSEIDNVSLDMFKTIYK